MEQPQENHSQLNMEQSNEDLVCVRNTDHVQGVLTITQHGFTQSDLATTFEEISVVVKGMPDDVDGTSGIVDELSDSVYDIAAVAGDMSGSVKDTSFSMEEAKVCALPDDKTLLDLIGRASPYPATDFLKEIRSLSQAALDAALILACQFGFKYLVQKLVQLGADIECQDASRKTPLLICVENRYLDLVRLLLARGADVKVKDVAGNNALILSINFAGSTEMTQLLMQQADIEINHQNNDGCTALMKAVQVMDLGTVQLLLDGYRSQTLSRESSHHYRYDYDWPLEYQNDNYLTLLNQTVNCRGENAQQIAKHYGLENVFTLLQDCCYNCKSPLLAAVEICDLEMVSLLLDSIKEIHAKSDVVESLSHILGKLEKDENRLTKEEVAILTKLYECDANMERLAYSYLIPAPAVSAAVKAGDYNLVKLLCKHGAPLDETDYSSLKLPLIVAAELGRVDIMELLISYKATDETDFYTGSSLDRALIHGHVDCARFLLHNGAELDIRSAVVSALENQVPEYLKFLLQHYENETICCISKETMTGNSLLIEAVKGGNQEIIAQILQAGVDINAPYWTGATPIVESKNGAVAMFLIQRGADVNQVINTHETPLIRILKKMPCSNNSFNEEVVRVLLENGACVNAKAWDDQTPLMMAAVVEGRESILQMLLDYGADYADRDNYGNTALMQAIQFRCSKNASFLIRVKKNNTYLLNLQNKNAYTALLCDAWNGHCRVTSELIDNGADVNITDRYGNTALSLAVTCSDSSESYIKLLSESGCDINHQNNEGLSPLMGAAWKCNYRVVSTLIDLGADVNAVSHEDTSLTALSIITAYNKNGLDCLEVLLDNGADASYLRPCVLFTIITRYQHQIIPKLIRSGLAPMEVRADQVTLRANHRDKLPLVSPLCLALLIGNVTLARYFWWNVFLTNSDISCLMSNRFMQTFLQRPKYKECIRFFGEIFSQPISLFGICFVAVSSAIGASPGRKDRVNQLPLPQVMKDKLLFKTEVVTLATPENEDFNIPFDVADLDYHVN